ncbi:hypothetical protein, partial [Enterobacter hormaechei]|uniref:hypothetical protein n=1 Tax=Enterobacter hormaechei TaxID=158836 RepID=UPI00197AD796
ERRALPHPVSFQTAVLSVYGKFIPRLSRSGTFLFSTYINTLKQLGMDEQQTAVRTEENMARLRSERRALPHPVSFQTAVLSVYGKFIPRLSRSGTF